MKGGDKKPMDGTGFGALNEFKGHGNGLMLKDGTCINQNVSDTLN